MAMSKRDQIGLAVLLGLFALLILLLYLFANEPIGSGDYFKNV